MGEDIPKTPKSLGHVSDTDDDTPPKQRILKAAYKQEAIRKAKLQQAFKSIHKGRPAGKKSKSDKGNTAAGGEDRG